MLEQETPLQRQQALLREAAGVYALYRDAKASLLALDRDKIPEHLSSYEAFQSAETAAAKDRVISMAGLKRGLAASYNKAKGTVEVDVEDAPLDVLQELFACNARPVYTCAPLWLWSFTDVSSFYKALGALDDTPDALH